MQRITCICPCGQSFSIDRASLELAHDRTIPCFGRQLLGCSRRFQASEILKSMNRFESEYHFPDAHQEKLGLIP